jgi:hypothetical protein
MTKATINRKKAAKAIAEALCVNIVEAQDLVPVFVRKAA